MPIKTTPFSKRVADVLKNKCRPYQVQAVKAFMSRGLKRKKNGDFPKAQIVCATGGGKTYMGVTAIAKAMASGKVRSCLWLAHRQELVTQAEESMVALFPEITTGRWTADTKQIGSVTFASVQSCRTIHETKKDWDLICIDESHHCSDSDNSYTRLLDRLDDCPVLGLTATPYRLDGKDLVFTSTLIEIRPIELIKEGHLAKPVYLPFQTGQHYAMDKRGSKADFTSKSLRNLDNDDRNQALVDLISDRRVELGQMIVFAIDIENAENLEKMLRDQTNLRVKTITGATDGMVRKLIRSDMSSGSIDVVINVAVFTEGFDAPSVNTVILARPTASKSLLLQMIGRGFRKAYDRDGNCIKDSFNLVTVEDQIQTFHELIRSTLPEVSPEAEVTAEEERKEKELQEGFLGRLDDALGNAKEIEPLKGVDRLNAVGVLRHSNYYKHNQGFLLTEGRLDCISRLRIYAGSLAVAGSVNRDSLVQSFTHCVPGGEISRKKWEDLVYGYWLYWFKNEHIVKDDAGNNHPTWDMRIDEELEESEVLKDSLARANSSYLQIVKTNDAFNAYWENRPINLFDSLIQISHKIASKDEKYQLTQFCHTVDKSSLFARNRILVIRTSLNGDWGNDLRIIGIARRVMSAAIEELLDDSCSGVSIKIAR